MTETVAHAARRADVRQERGERVLAQLEANGWAALVTTSFESFAFFSTTWIPSFHWNGSRGVFAVIDGDGVSFIVSSLHACHLQEQGVTELIEYIADQEEPAEALAAVLVERGYDGDVAVESGSLSPGQLELLAARLSPHRELVSGDRVLARERRVKDAWELEEITRVGHIVANASLEAVHATRPGESELDLACRIDVTTLQAGLLDGVLTVGSGRRSSLTHPWPSTKELVDGEILRIDVVRRSAFGYFGDIARTFAVGTPSSVQRRRYSVAASALEAATEELKPGAELSRVYEACRATFEQNGEVLSFPHVGHAGGLELHEAPMLLRDTQETCEAGMVFCVEAILQAESAGEWYQLEQLVRVGPDGPERLTRTPPDIPCLEGPAA